MGNTFWTSHEVGNMILAVGTIAVLFIVLFLAFFLGINPFTVLYFLLGAALFVLIGVWIYVGIRVIAYFDAKKNPAVPKKAGEAG